MHSRATLDTIRGVGKTVRIFASFIGILAYLLMPVKVLADGGLDNPGDLPPVVISEVQAGSSNSASEEFIELYNTTAQTIDFSEYVWQVQIAGSSATDWSSPQRTITLSGVLEPGQSYLLASQSSSVKYLPEISRLWFSAGIAASAAHIRLIYFVNHNLGDDTCGQSQTLVDEVEWSAPKNGVAAKPSLDGREVFVTSRSSGLASGTSLQRLLRQASLDYRDSGSDVLDFEVAEPTPGQVGSLLDSGYADGNEASVGMPMDDCTPGGTDSEDEEEDEDEDDLTEQESSDQESSQSEDTDDTDAGESGESGEVSDGQSSVDGTNTNVNEGLKPPTITELLPNPASPLTDSADEFIELFNPNDQAFNLEGYLLETGTTTKHRYTFPAGTVLQPGAYAAFFSASTGLSLSNSGGQARLLDPEYTVLSETLVYDTAKDNQSWSYIDGKWQWSSTPTPNAANAISAIKADSSASKSSASSKKSSSSSTKSKSTSAKTQAAKSTSGSQDVYDNAAATRRPIHIGILAVIGAIAIIYGAYEYRKDLANYFQRLRLYRTDRRKNRQELKRRRNH